MRIIKVEIEEFGKLRGCTLEPAAGLTLIEGENESGKSTLLAFFRFALYGFPRKNSAEGDERDKRLSWQGRMAAGRLTIEGEAGQFCIARRAYLRGDSLCEELTVLRLPEGESVELEGKSPGEYFLGLPVELYESSLCITQNGVDRVSSPAVGEGVGEALFADGGSFAAGDAERRLMRAHRELQHLKGRGGRIAELEDRLCVLEGELTQSKACARRLSELGAERRACREALERERQEWNEIMGALERIEIERMLQMLRDRDVALEEERRCRDLLEQARAEIPALDMTVIEALTRLSHRCADLRMRLNGYVSELERIQARDRGVDAVVAVRAIEEMGGNAAVVRRVEKKHRQKRISGITGAVFLVIAVALAAFGAWPLRPFLLIAAGVAGGLALLCLALLFCAGAALRGIRRTLGVPPCGMLRTYLEQLQLDAAAAQAMQSRTATLERESETVRQELEDSAAALSTALSNVGMPALAGDPAGLSDFLSKETARCEARRAAEARLLPLLERAAGMAEALNRRLEGVSKESLQQRLAVLPAVTGSREQLEARRVALADSLQERETCCTDLERAESAQAAACTDTDGILREKALVTAALNSAKARLAAVRLAQTALEEAAGEMRRSITPRLGQRANEILQTLTGGAHGALRLASDFSVTLEDMGLPRPLSRFSAGCADAAHLSLRLAVLETVCKESMPLLLDESLSRLDDHRAAAMLQALVNHCAAGGQCLLFTCHTREAELLQGQGVRRLHMRELNLPIDK